jgi:uncharacterized tellurite resistance protein B-like protein
MKRRHILKHLAGPVEPTEEALHSFSREQVAAAALMVECARVDTKIAEGERAIICSAVREHFGLDSETSNALVEVAEKRTEELWDNWLFLDAVKRGFSEEKRIQILGALWEVAYSDGRMHRFEEELIDHIARELDIPEAEIEKTRAHAWTRVNEPKEKPGK